MESGTKNHGKNLINENIDKKYYCSNYYESVSINMVLNAEHR